jgi:hypothetical protein
LETKEMGGERERERENIYSAKPRKNSFLARRKVSHAKAPALYDYII